MTSVLPYTLTVDGVEYDIKTDFRVALHILKTFGEKDLSPLGKQYMMLDNLFVDELPPDLNEATRQAAWFLDGGNIVSSNETQHKTLDYEQDAPLLFSAVNKAAGYEVRRPDIETHWWTFMGFALAIDPDSKIGHIVHLRQKRAKGEKLDAHELQFYRENKHLVDMKSAEEDYEEMALHLRRLGGENV